MPKFVSDILARANLMVDGIVYFNNTATGQTPASNDNSTKLATTAWVRTFVQPYNLPIASSSVLGGIKVGEGLSIDAGTGVLSAAGGGSVTSFRSEYIITATAGQTTFTVPNGYTPGKIDLFLNGVYLNDTIYTATNSSTIVLDDAAALDDILTVFVYSTYYVGDSPSARTTTYFTATSNQTVFTVAYVIGQVDIFYNGSKLEPSEYTANNGTSITLLTPATTGDKIEVVNWAVGGGIAATRTITIDGVAQNLTANRTWNILPTGGAAGDILAKTSATNYAVAWIPNYTSTVQHTVKAAVSLTAGQAIYVSSADGTNMIVSKASNALEQTSSKTLGLVAQNLAINGQGFVVTEGLLAGLDTTGATAAGDPVWLGTDGNLIYGLANKPVAPAHLVFIGVVTRRNANNGEIFVKVQNGFELDELHDLSVKNASDGDMIKYVASTGLWTKIAATTTNIAEGTNLYYTNTRSRTAISLTTSGTSGAATYDNATGVINIPQYQGGVTSFNTRTGAITLSSSDVTTALTYTPVTNARTLTINGTTYDLTADRSWSIAAGVTSFNTRTGAISLTSLDVTDALTYTPVTNARTITINGTSYDLSANRSWTIAPDVSVRNTYAFTATAAQTTFTVSGGYTVGLVDVFINGVKLAAADFTATNGTTVVLAVGTSVGNIVEIVKYVSAFTAAQEALNGTGLVRMSGTTVSYDNATYATQSYVTTAVANLVNSAPSTLDTLNELATALGNDANFATTITTSIGTKQAQLNGTGFVKISGTTISYDNSTYLTTASASSTYQTLLTNPVTGTGTTNYLPKFTGASTIGNSNLSDNGNTLEYQGTGFKGLEINSTNNSTSLRLEAYSASTNADNGIKEIEIDGYYSSFNSYFGFNSSGAEWRMTGFADTAANTTNRATTTWQIPSLNGTYGYFDVTSYHSATPIIRAFASNNVVIGGSTNNSFKLEVVGTTKISGVLTLGSTIGNGTFTYTLPAATGTLALTSNLSAYLPLTGGTLTGALTGTSASFSSTLKVGGAVGNFLIDSYTTSKIGIRSWTDIAGTTNNFFLQNNASYNYGILGVVSASGTATGDVYGLGYTPSAGTSMTSVVNWTSEDKVWSTKSFGVGVSPNHGALDVRSSSTSISTLDGVAGFFKNTPKGGGLTIRVHDTQVDLAATWFYGATNMDLTLTTVGTDAVYRERIRIQASDGAMAFNTSIIGVRSYLFKALPGRQLAIEALESGGVHSIYLRPSGSGRHLIASNYFSGGVYLPLALSGRENDADMVLHPNGNIAIASATDIGTKLQVNGANYVEMATFACTTASTNDIVANNGGIVQFSSGNARHCSNTSLFVPVTNGIQITKPGILYVSFSQDITTAGSTGYVAGYISKNGSNISENLITNTGGQWDGITGVTTINVNASDIIGFNFNAADILSFDSNTWSNYSFIWTSR